MSPSEVVGRKYEMCPSTKYMPHEDLLATCDDCGYFTLYCCHHRDQVCHHTRVALTDGACLNNGGPLARSGVGIAFGVEEHLQFSVPITKDNDKSSVRSNQRAELVAARMATEMLIDNAKKNKQSSGIEAAGYHHRKGKDDTPDVHVVITDSEYVVSGMTDWFPKWEANKWRTSTGKVPANLDLFLEFDHYMSKAESEGFNIGFLWMPRECNTIADKLAKDAAKMGNVATASTVDSLSEEDSS